MLGESVDPQQRLPGGTAQPGVDRMPRAPGHSCVLHRALECILCFLNTRSGFGFPIVSGWPSLVPGEEEKDADSRL